MSTVTTYKLTEDVCISASNFKQNPNSVTEYKAYSVYENYVKVGNYKYSTYSVLPFLVFPHVVTCLLDRFVSAWLCCHSLNDSDEILPSSVTVKKLNMRLIYLILLRIAHVRNDKYIYLY